MGGREGVIDEHIAKGGHFGGQCGVVLFLTGMEAGVFQQYHVARTGGDDCLPCRGPHTIAAKDHLAAKRGLQRADQLTQAHLGDHLALGPVEMGQQHDFAATGDDILDRGPDLVDPGHVGHDPAFHRHVDVHPRQYRLARQCQVIDRLPGHLRLHAAFPLFPRNRREGQPKALPLGRKPG